jgi:diguanylate cyclase (GGDEF)-like protein
MPYSDQKSEGDPVVSETLDRIALRLAEFPGVVGAFCVAVALLVGFADYSSGIAMSMAVFYVLPVTIAAFVFGLVPGLLMACFVAAVNLSAEWLQFRLDSEIPPSVALWNSLSRLTISVLLTVLISALRKQWHHEKIVARIDVTTGAANARALLERLEESLASARRGAFPLSVCLFDIDDFKRVNDAYGHTAGDRLLRHVARAAGEALRPGDTLARWGGDEFVLVLPGADSRDAGAAVERLVATLETAAAENVMPVTLSVGVVTTGPGSPGGANELLRKADELMYEAKRAGKNRTVSGTIAEKPRDARTHVG